MKPIKTNYVFFALLLLFQFLPFVSSARSDLEKWYVKRVDKIEKALASEHFTRAIRLVDDECFIFDENGYYEEVMGVCMWFLSDTYAANDMFRKAYYNEGNRSDRLLKYFSKTSAFIGDYGMSLVLLYQLRERNVINQNEMTIMEAYCVDKIVNNNGMYYSGSQK